MLESRLETALIRLARRHAPQLIPANWQQPGDYPGSLPALAGKLAGYNHLVLVGEPKAGDAAAQTQQWVDIYARLYDTLARTLFPSFNQISAQYADYDQPPIVIITGTATPVIVALAGFVAPYVAARQAQGGSDVELRGLMDIVLEELEAGDLPREDYRKLRDACVALLRQLLAAPVRQRPLTEPHPALAALVNFPPSTATRPVAETAPLPPEALPEADSGAANPFGASIPIFFDPQARGKRPPPVPDLPENR